MKATKTLALTAIYIQDAVDGVNPPTAAQSVPEKFTGPFDFVLLPGVGHFPKL